jgi:hypothetical protein
VQLLASNLMFALPCLLIHMQNTKGSNDASAHKRHINESNVYENFVVVNANNILIVSIFQTMI